MQTLTEKRVFGAKFGTTEVFVASETGLVVITVSADQIGEFGLAHREPVNAVAADDRGAIIGTDEDVLRVERGGSRDDSATPGARTVESVGSGPFGPVAAVGVGPAGVLAADPDGTVFRERAGKAGHAGEEADGTDVPDTTDATWTALGDTAGVRAIDGRLLAATDGVYQLSETDIRHVGLTDVRDVTAHGVPLAATAEGLFWLGNGWMSMPTGECHRVASDGHGHAHAVGSTGLLRREIPDASDAFGDGDGEWVADELPVESPVVDVAYGGGIVAAITEDGTLCVNAGDGWRHQLIGVRGVREIAVSPGESPDASAESRE